MHLKKASEQVFFDKALYHRRRSLHAPQEGLEALLLNKVTYQHGWFLHIH